MNKNLIASAGSMNGREHHNSLAIATCGRSENKLHSITLYDLIIIENIEMAERSLIRKFYIN